MPDACKRTIDKVFYFTGLYQCAFFVWLCKLKEFAVESIRETGRRFLFDCADVHRIIIIYLVITKIIRKIINIDTKMLLVSINNK